MTSDGVHSYTYDAEGRITHVDGTANAFTYDGGGFRVGKNGIVYVAARGRVIAEYLSGAAPTVPNVEYIYAGGQRVATIASGTINYHYADHLSVRASADSTGTVTRTYGHFPFGETWYETGTPNKWKFTTYERDADSEGGLDYADARFDSTRIGRFMSLDPLAGSIADPQSLNRYNYVVNDPINLIDPTGTAPNDPTNYCEILENGGLGFCAGGTGCTVDGQAALNCGSQGEFAGGVSFGTCPPDCGVGVGVSTTAFGSIAFGGGDPESEERRLDCIAEGGTHCGNPPADFLQFDLIAGGQGGVFFGCHTDRCRQQNPSRKTSALRRCLANAQATENKALQNATAQISIGILGILGDTAIAWISLPAIADMLAGDLAAGDLTFPSGHAAAGVGTIFAAPAVLYVNGVTDATKALSNYDSQVDACWAAMQNSR
jgi:RHS repeat-associated protein